MRFRFCGESDCPDWVLAQIGTLSRLSSVKLKSLAQHVAVSVAQRSDLDPDKVAQLLADVKLEDAPESCTACLAFILTSAARHQCSETSLSAELLQLGLPREHSLALRRVFADNLGPLTAMLRSSSLKVNRLMNPVIVDDSAALPMLDLDQRRIGLHPTTAASLLNDLRYLQKRMAQLSKITE